MEGHTQRVFCVDVNDTCLFSGSADKTIKVGQAFLKSYVVQVWDLRTRGCIQTVEGHQRGVKSLTVGNQLFFSGSNDTTIKVPGMIRLFIHDFQVWNLKTFECQYTFVGHSKWVKRLCKYGQNLYSCSYDQTIRVQTRIIISQLSGLGFERINLCYCNARTF